MLKNRLLLCAVAFIASLVISLFINQDFLKSLGTALITVISTYIAAVFSDNQQKRQRSYLRYQIQTLEKLKKRLYFNIDDLKSNLNQMHNQVLVISEQRQSLNREVTTLGEYKYQLQTQLPSFLAQVQALEVQENNLNQSLLTITNEKQIIEATVQSLITKQNQLQTQLEEQQSNFKKQKLHQDKTLGELESQIQELEQRREELNHSIMSAMTEKQNIAIDLKFLQEQMISLEAIQDRLQKQVAELHSSKEIPKEEISDIESNELALDIINDLIVEPGSVLVPPAIASEHLATVQKMLSNPIKIQNQHDNFL